MQGLGHGFVTGQRLGQWKVGEREREREKDRGISSVHLWLSMLH